jgi:hypothetical protein
MRTGTGFLNHRGGCPKRRSAKRRQDGDAVLHSIHMDRRFPMFEYELDGKWFLRTIHLQRRMRPTWRTWSAIHRVADGRLATNGLSLVRARFVSGKGTQHQIFVARNLDEDARKRFGSSSMRWSMARRTAALHWASIAS